MFENKKTDFFSGIKLSRCAVAIAGSALLAFGLYNIHSVSDITEGGVLGLILLIDHWFDISPAISGFILNVLCYVLGWKLLGRHFIIYSAVATAGFSFFYRIFEMSDPLFPWIADMPFVASVAGAVFVGVSAGMCVRIGGAPSGDDALAMSLSKVTRFSIQTIYLISDLTVLALSLSYIPVTRIFYSLITVVISGQIIGIMQQIGKTGNNKAIEKS